MTWLADDRLPNSGITITVVVFGLLTLVILGGALFLASRRHHRAPPPPPTSRVLTDLIFAQKAQKGFGADANGQAESEGGESGPPKELGPEA